MAKVIAVCSSQKKGTPKIPVSEGIFRENYGLVGDAHADCNTHRQVSLLAIESIKKMQNLGYTVKPGDFAENITTEGINILTLPIATSIAIGEEVILEITQHGKECHTGCAVFKQMGKCIMPLEGVFARVIRGGTIRAGNTIMVPQQKSDK